MNLSRRFHPNWTMREGSKVGGKLLEGRGGVRGVHFFAFKKKMKTSQMPSQNEYARSFILIGQWKRVQK